MWWAPTTREDESCRSLPSLSLPSPLPYIPSLLVGCSLYIYCPVSCYPTQPRSFASISPPRHLSRRRPLMPSSAQLVPPPLTVPSSLPHRHWPSYLTLRFPSGFGFLVPRSCLSCHAFGRTIRFLFTLRFSSLLFPSPSGIESFGVCYRLCGFIKAGVGQETVGRRAWSVSGTSHVHCIAVRGLLQDGVWWNPSPLSPSLRFRVLRLYLST